MRVTAGYTGSSTSLGGWQDSRRLTEESFGPVSGWPLLPENDYLGPVLGLELPLPLPPTATEPPA